MMSTDKKYSYDKIIEILSNNNSYIDIAKEGIRIINKLMHKENISKHDAVRSKSFTTTLSNELKNQLRKSTTPRDQK